VIPIAPIQECNEDPAVEKDLGRAHGISRPYTTESTVVLSPTFPSNTPA
jgi:hypothetical protein